MKLKILALAVAGCFGGMLHASTVVSCGWSQTAINSCNGVALPSFTSQLDWAAFGVDGTVHGTGLWTASLSNGMNITVSTANVASGEGARTGVNYGSVYYNGIWYDYNGAPVAVPAAFVGHFDAPTTPYVYSYANPGVGLPGDHLMGLAGNGAAGSTSKSLIIDFGATQNPTDFAFRIAAVNLNSFNVTLNMYSGANGGGTLLGSYSLSNLTGGGTCAALRPGTLNVPSPCNDANLIAATNVLNARSIQLQTNDPSGFYIGDIYAVSAPEPATFLFAGCGVLLLALGRKKLRKA